MNYVSMMAAISDCRRYRPMLMRQWGFGELAYSAEKHESTCTPKMMAIIGLNPSTADAMKDDPTIRRCVAFAQREGMDGLWMVNLFDWRETESEKLRHVADLNSVDADKVLLDYCTRADIVVAAWGAKGGLRGRDKEVMRLLQGSKVSVKCFGTSKDGHPKHPLYLRADTPLVPFTS